MNGKMNRQGEVSKRAFLGFARDGVETIVDVPLLTGMFALALIVVGPNSFDGATGHSRHDEPAGGDHEDHRRDGGQNTSRQEKSPVDPVLAHRLVKLEGQRLQIAVGDQAQGKNEVSPGNQETEYPDG